MLEGKVGSRKMTFKTPPRGKSGSCEIELEGGRVETIRWVRDEQGMWIETPRGYRGFDIRKTTSDEGLASVTLLERFRARIVSGSFFKKGEEDSAASSSRPKKAIKIKSQMPGKIVRILVKAGDSVVKGQSLVVMEAMKMENEIKSPQDGKIQDVKVSEGQAVENGAELVGFSSS